LKLTNDTVIYKNDKKTQNLIDKYLIYYD